MTVNEHRNMHNNIYKIDDNSTKSEGREIET